MEKQQYLGFHSNVFGWQCSFLFNCHVLHHFTHFFISLPGAEKMVDDHLGYHHRKPPSKPF
jgi:hypothetical protein